MSRIRIISTIVAFAASALVSGTAFAASHYGTDADPYPKMMTQHHPKASSQTNATATGSVKEAPASAEPAVVHKHKGN
jgi:hypothetical protein